ncbi:MAG: argH [Cytophagaceae bacterium]|nr:argH [Cytophagaceae bacterium]
MPHKKNPDVFELIRAKSNKLQALPNEIAMITANLPSGYHRDLQLIKESFVPAFTEITDCIALTKFMLSNIQIKQDILKDEKYKYLFSVDVVNDLVNKGTPFRDAYKQVGTSIDNGTFKPLYDIQHTHEGSIGNLMNKEITGLMDKVLSGFEFSKVEDAVKRLLA